MEREKMEETKSTNPLNQDEIQIYLKDIRKLKVMTPERERALAERISSTDCTDREKNAIQKEMLEGNLRFVITVAKQYQNQGVDLSDLIAEGNYGLMKAIKNFDWSKKNRFISYAVWWIKQSILQSLNDNSRTIRLPVNVVQDMQKEKRENEKTNKELSSKFASLPRMVDLDMHINEEEPWKKLLEGLLGEIPIVGFLFIYLLNPSYLISMADGTPALRATKKPSIFERYFVIEKLADIDEDDELRALLSLLMMVLLEKNRG